MVRASISFLLPTAKPILPRSRPGIPKPVSDSYSPCFFRLPLSLSRVRQGPHQLWSGLSRTILGSYEQRNTLCQWPLVISSEPPSLPVKAGMAELVDAPDLGSGVPRTCRFESCSRYVSFPEPGVLAERSSFGITCCDYRPH